MVKPLQLPLFDVGFELEFFLTKESSVYYASSVLEEALGFSIDQNKNMAGALALGGSSYGRGTGYVLRTDGTAAELQWFEPYNCGTLPPKEAWAKRLADLKVISGYKHTFEPYLKAGEGSPMFPYGVDHPIVFVNPGKTYGSGKIIINAYTGEERYGKKKDGVDDVTERTAGLHLHFSLNKHHRQYEPGDQVKQINDLIFGRAGREGNKHTSALVKILDSIYEELFVKDRSILPFRDSSKRRVDRYQTLGDYRIKHCDTSTDQPTLEYRQLDSFMSVYQWGVVQRLIDTFQYEALKYLNGVA